MRKRTPRCPQCHSRGVVPIKYCEPTIETMEAARCEEIILVPTGWQSGDGPQLHCFSCGYEWGGDPAPLSDDLTSFAFSRAR